MAHSRPMKSIRILANLVEQVRHLPLPHKSVTMKIEFLIRTGMDHYIMSRPESKDDDRKVDTSTKGS